MNFNTLTVKVVQRYIKALTAVPESTFEPDAGHLMLFLFFSILWNVQFKPGTGRYWEIQSGHV